MPLLGFKKQFAPLVESGANRQTIRLKRKDGKNPHPGDTLYLYTGLRTKGCRKLGTAICTGAWDVGITKCGPVLTGIRLDPDEAGELAARDGFSCFGDMQDFFEKEHSLPFWGLLIEWGEMEGDDGQES